MIATNPLNLTDDQKMELGHILINLIREGVISVDQQERIEEALLGIYMTLEEEEYERRNVSQTEKPRPGVLPRIS